MLFCVLCTFSTFFWLSVQPQTRTLFFTQDMKDFIAQPWLRSAVLAMISVCSDIELRAGSVDQTGCEQANNLARLIKPLLLTGNTESECSWKQEKGCACLTAVGALNKGLKTGSLGNNFLIFLLPIKSGCSGGLLKTCLITWLHILIAMWLFFSMLACSQSSAVTLASVTLLDPS